MSISLGIALAFAAMLLWGFGDFLIQKSTRKVGDWETLLFITLFGAVVLLPFVWNDLPSLFNGDYKVLVVILIASISLFAAAIIDFEALRKGKLSIVEPLWSLEVPIAAFFAFFLISERISWLQTIFIVGLLVCLMLVSFREKKFNRAVLLEKGAILAIAGAILMGSANFFMGWGGRVSNPLMVNFCADVFMLVASIIYIVARHKVNCLFCDFKNSYKLLVPMALLDNSAWIAYVLAMTLAPIAVATALSESYIIIAVLLGLFMNKERLQLHQKIGLVGAVVSAIVLSMITSF
ncbi:MAG: DMT family transporter [Parcubacteria group bacterium]